MTTRTLQQPLVLPGSVVGLGYNGGHDSSVSVVAPDGRITFACALERVTRYKQDGRFPSALLELIDFNNVSACALPCYSNDGVPVGLSGQRFHSLQHSAPDYQILEFPDAFYGDLETIPVPKVFVGHEVAHAASAYYLSGFTDAAVLSYDAGMYNEPWFGGVFRAARRDIEPIEFFPARTNAKLASLYAVMTGVLGYMPLRHEGKLTGLAAHGRPDATCIDVMQLLLTEDYAELERAARWINAFGANDPPQFIMDVEQCSKLRARFGAATPETIAASLQHLTEQHIVEIVLRIREAGISDRLCVAGGLFANVKVNQRIHEAWGGSMFVAPPMGDDGAGLGAALYHAYQTSSAVFPSPQNMYCGFSFKAEEIGPILDAHGVIQEQPERPDLVLAELLAQGSTIGVFIGRMEFGPRALGNRSILAPADDSTINDRLNRKLRRTEFMPFAPITREEDASRSYKAVAGAEHTAEFMTIAFQATDELTATCPAVVHVDGSARPQLVRADVHPFLHGVLTEYQRLTGRTSLINTSFNIHEEPIVCTPEDALRGFIGARLDYLFIEGYLISLERNLRLLVQWSDDMFAAGTAERRSRRSELAYLWSEIHKLQQAADERLTVVEQLNATAQRYQARIQELQNQLEAPANAGDEVDDSSGGMWPTEVSTRLNGIERRLDRLEQQSTARRRGPDEARPSISTVDPSAEALIASLQQASRSAEMAAEARLLVIQEQQRALEHYRRFRFGYRVSQLTAPRLGVLYQYAPRVLDIPKRYLEVRAPAAEPTISIVTPTLNQGAFLERTLRSVLDQHYEKLEYIVRDGASTDNTLSVLRTFEDRLADIRSERDGGFSAALNLGFARTSGEIMAYLNSDDLLLPGTLSYIARYFDEHPDVDVLYGHRIVIDEYDQEIGRWVLPPHDDPILSWADYVPQETMFWRRRVWDRIGASVDETFSFAVDWDLLIRFRDSGARMKRLPRFLGAFRVHPHQKTSAEMADVGLGEMSRLRERCHGRQVGQAEIDRNVRPYLRRHVFYHKAYRLGLLRY